MYCMFFPVLVAQTETSVLLQFYAYINQSVNVILKGFTGRKKIKVKFYN